MADVSYRSGASMTSSPENSPGLLDPYQPKPRNRRLVTLIDQIGVGVVIVGIWQMVNSLGLINKLVSRSPLEVLVALGKVVSASDFFMHLWSTLSATIVAFVLASAVGIVAGVLLGLLPRTERATAPYLSLFNSIPRTAFAPIFLVYLGIGQSSKIALAFSIVVFVVLVNAKAGVRSVDPDIMRLARVLGMNKRQLFTKILMPSAVPSIFAGLWLGVIYSLLGVVTSEIISSRAGLGQLVSAASGVFELETVYAVVFILGVIGMVLNMIMVSLERYLLRWQNNE